MKFKKVIQLFMAIMLFASLSSLKAMDFNIASFEGLPNEMTSQILQFIANLDAFENVSQADINQIKKLAFISKKLEKQVSEPLEKIKFSTWKYLNSFLGNIDLLISKAIELNTQFSASYLKSFSSNDEFKLNSEIVEKINENFMSAIVNNQLKKVRFLINAGADFNFQDEDGDIAITLASYHGHKEIIRLLIKAEADLDIKDEDGHTALIWASFKGYKEIVELLIEAADLDVQDEFGDTALILASQYGYKEIVELLIRAEADPNIKDEAGDTALVKASRSGHKEIVKLLEKHFK